MKLKLVIIMFFLFTGKLAIGQKAAVAAIIEEIDFGQDTLKAVYDWITDNIRYDVKKLKQIKKTGRKIKGSKFESQEDFDNHRLEKVMKSKKGICHDYTLLFDALVKTLGYESFKISGYTKNSKGQLNRHTGHAWNAVKVNNDWKLFDVTWGAGYVEDEKKFIKKYKVQWFDVEPELMLVNHMPFDPIWQLSNQPITYKQFEKNVDEDSGFENFNYSETIAAFLSLDNQAKMQEQLERSEKGGKGIKLVETWRKNLSRHIEVKDMRRKEGDFKIAESDYRAASKLFGKYIEAKNKRFKGKKYDLSVAENFLHSADSKVSNCINILESVDVNQKNAKSFISKNLRSSKKLQNKIDSEIKYLDSL